jgi:hypothetical protein
VPLDRRSKCSHSQRWIDIVRSRRERLPHAHQPLPRLKRTTSAPRRGGARRSRRTPEPHVDVTAADRHAAAPHVPDLLILDMCADVLLPQRLAIRHGCEPTGNGPAPLRQADRGANGCASNGDHGRASRAT